MKLADLEPYFLKIEDERTFRFEGVSINEADGVWFECPKCRNHSIRCWQPHVPQAISPTGGRWPFSGSGLDDLTLTPSISLESSCGAHFFVRNGEITW
jgi:hypothetical protein